MKNLLLLALFLCTGISYAQNVKLNLIGSLDYSKSEYTYAGGFPQALDSGQVVPLPLGYSLALQTEFSLGEKITFLTGLSYSQKNYYPQLNLGFVYGWLPDPNNLDIYVQNAYIKAHKFKTIAIPLMLKIRFSKSNKLKPYFGFGFNTTFRFQEQEVFGGNRWDEETFALVDHELVFSNKDFDFFSTAFDLALGFQYELKPGLDLIFNHQISAWEFRAGNEKFKENGSMLYENTLFSFSNLSLGIGIQKTFGKNNQK